VKDVRRCALYVATVFLTLGTAASAATFTFDTDPFAGTDVLATPGRQVVGGEDVITFSIASDVFQFEPSVFGVASSVLFANDVVANLPTSGVNVIVLQTTDDDANSTTAFAAGSAANLIAAQITSPGPGFFIYFNSGLDLPRLVYSTDLSDTTADLKVLARMSNLAGQSGALATFTESNFTMIPEPSTLLLVTTTGALWACGHRVRRGRARHAPFRSRPGVPQSSQRGASSGTGE
jgi:hypothetical protein